MVLIQSRLTSFGAALFILVMTTGCTTQTNILNRNNAQSGRLLLWHTWTGAEGRILNDTLENYMEIYPEVSIVSTVFDEDAVVSAFAAQSDGGLGPDLLLIDAATVYELATAGLIQDLAQHN